MEKAKVKKKAAKKIEEMLFKEEWLAKSFGLIKSFEDGLQYQKSVRNGK